MRLERLPVDLIQEIALRERTILRGSSPCRGSLRRAPGSRRPGIPAVCPTRSRYTGTSCWTTAVTYTSGGGGATAAGFSQAVFSATAIATATSIVRRSACMVTSFLTSFLRSVPARRVLQQQPCHPIPPPHRSPLASVIAAGSIDCGARSRAGRGRRTSEITGAGHDGSSARPTPICRHDAVHEATNREIWHDRQNGSDSDACTG